MKRGTTARSPQTWVAFPRVGPAASRGRVAWAGLRRGARNPRIPSACRAPRRPKAKSTLLLRLLLLAIIIMVVVVAARVLGAQMVGMRTTPAAAFHVSRAHLGLTVLAASFFSAQGIAARARR